MKLDIGKAAVAEVAEKLMKIHDALDDALGDSDITHIEDDAELRDEYPTQWAAQHLMEIINELQAKPAGG
jgi:hypothetical protein